MSVENRIPNAPSRSEEAPAALSGKLADPRWAWAPYKPDTQRPWDLRWAGHLYRRAAFGATWDQLQQAVADGPQRTVDRLMQPDADVAAFNGTYDEYEASATDSGSTDALRAWWLRRMIRTPHPLLEKMMLFWHNYFATSNVKVKSALLMYRHIQLLRRHALGRFELLLEAVSHDPAMLVGLDSETNRKARPNENYARELFQTFGLGLGRFSEADIREAARAFTGWFVLRNNLRYIPREHDAGVKKVLGQEGNFNGKDVVRIVLRQPTTHRLLVRKLYRWLISETDEPPDTLIAPPAESFGKDYDVSKLVSTMLRSNLFFSSAAYRRRIKGPVEFALGIVQGLEASVSTTQLGQDLAALGQNLYCPPTVKGWQGDRHWINNATLVGRSNLALALLAGSKPYGDKLAPSAIAEKHGYSSPEAARKFLLDLFLQGDVEDSVRKVLLKTALGPATLDGGEPSRWLRQFAHRVVTLPEFQLA